MAFSLHILVPARFASLEPTALCQQLSVQQIILEQPDSHLRLEEQNDILACCSLWWQSLPSYNGYQVGYIGHYHAINPEAGTRLLFEASQVLKEQGCTLAIGPMNGSTWRSYRFITKGQAPPFFLEPEHPAAYPQHWREAGFETLARYTSTLQRDLEVENPKLDAMLANLASQGVSFRSLESKQVEAELERIYELSLLAFEDNFLYTPIVKADFMQMYQHLLAVVDPELCLIAEAKQPIAFLFTLPDLAQQQRGEAMNQLIVKTLAVSPEYRGLGIGTAMVGHVFRLARQKGFHQAVHALMIEDNHSQYISRHYQVEKLREYSLFSKAI